MARLNDPPVGPPVESIDALKRRFIRQNREIARVNSTQSLRIRNLEAEISRLLAENISIREQAINIAQESEKWRAAYKAKSEIAALKNRLEAKLQEVNTIVTELGELPERTARRKSGPRKSIIVVNNARSPAAKEWRNQQTIGGVLNAERAEQEGRLPAILEEKSYPRRTLDHTELQTPVDDLGNPLESPEIGPPPVAHFDVPEVDDSNQNMDPEKSPQPQKQPQPIVPLSVNLENRRKRRTSALLQNIPKDDDPPVVLPDPQSVPMLKAGAKRKLDASILDDKRNAAMITTDDFVFKKAERDIDPQGTRFTRPIRKPVQDTVPVASPVKEPPAARRILAPKSTNSPSKARVRVGEKSTMARDGPQEQLKVAKRPDRVATTTSAVVQEWKPEELDATLHGQPPPKTPFSEDVLSPASTEPSARVQEMAITNSVEDVLNGSIGRGSRRARAAVSYAEPSLRDKMRRPGKELVGAVEGIDKRAREGSFGPERTVSEGPTPIPTQAKHERPEIPVEWKKVPQAKEEAPSPLRDKQSKTPEDMKEQQKHAGKRRFSGKATLGVSADYTADFTITDDDELENAVRRLSIFDPPSSSPAAERVSDGLYPDTIEVEPVKRSKSVTATITATDRKARRHSVATNPSLMADLSHSRSVSDLSNTRPSSRQSLASSRPGSAAGQRPSSTASLRAGEGRASHEIARKTSTSKFGPDARVASEVKKKSTDRVAADTDMAGTRASRRRSMMV
jgi:hypothetical protein